MTQIKDKKVETLNTKYVMNKDKNKKKLKTESKLPQFLCIRPDGYSFHSVTNEDDQCGFLQKNLNGACFQLVEPSNEFEGCEMYCDEDGMCKQLPLNRLANPFINYEQLLEMIPGGPYGTYILKAEEFHLESKLHKSILDFFECDKIINSDDDDEEEKDKDYYLETEQDKKYFIKNLTKAIKKI